MKKVYVVHPTKKHRCGICKNMLELHRCSLAVYRSSDIEGAEIHDFVSISLLVCEPCGLYYLKDADREKLRFKNLYANEVSVHNHFDKTKIPYVKSIPRRCGHCLSSPEQFIQKIMHIPIFSDYNNKQLQNGTLCISVPFCSSCGMHAVKPQDEIIIREIENSYVLKPNIRDKLPHNDIAFQVKNYFNPSSIQVKTSGNLKTSQNVIATQEGIFVNTKHLALPNTNVNKKEDLIIAVDSSEYSEGNLVLKTHKIRERNPEVIKKAKKLFKNKNDGEVFCEACGFNFSVFYGERGAGFIEGHHKIPVSEMSKDDVTRVEDIALLCSNCHRMVHQKPFITVEELRNYIRKGEEI